MNHKEMSDQVADEIRNASAQTKITRWLNLAIVELATNFMFGHLHTYGSKQTVAGTPDIVLDSNFLWLKTIAIPVNNSKLWPRDEQRLSEAYPKYRSTQGTVTHYYIHGVTLGLWQVPADIKTVEYAYQRRPTKLAGIDLVNETSDLPEEWHSLICQKATTLGYSSEGNTEGKASSVAEERKKFVLLGTNVHKRPDETFVLGGPTYSRRPPRPKFPSSFPSIGH